MSHKHGKANVPGGQFAKASYGHGGASQSNKHVQLTNVNNPIHRSSPGTDHGAEFTRPYAGQRLNNSSSASVVVSHSSSSNPGSGRPMVQGVPIARTLTAQTQSYKASVSAPNNNNSVGSGSFRRAMGPSMGSTPQKYPSNFDLDALMSAVHSPPIRNNERLSQTGSASTESMSSPLDTTGVGVGSPFIMVPSAAADEVAVVEYAGTIPTKTVNIICSFCLPLECLVYFRVYSHATHYEYNDFSLAKVASLNGIYFGYADVPYGRFEGKIVFCPGRRDKIEEYVVFQGFFHRTRKFVCREDTPFFVVVVKDVISSGLLGTSNAECEDKDYVSGWTRLIYYLADHICNEAVDVFVRQLAIGTDGSPSVSHNWARPVGSVVDLWDRFHHAVPDQFSRHPSTLVKFCLILDKLKKLTPTQNLLYCDSIGDVFLMFSAVETMQYVFSVANSTELFLPSFIPYLEQVCMTSTQKRVSSVVSWALFLNILYASMQHPNVRIVRDCFERFPDAMLGCIKDFFDFTPREHLSLVLGGLRTIRDLKQMEATLTAHNPGSPSQYLSILSQFVTAILSLARYEKPAPNTESSLLEFEAIRYFAKCNRELESSLFGTTTKDPYKLQVLGQLSVKNLAAVGLFPDIFDEHLSVKFKNRRIEEFVQCVRGSVESGISRDGTSANPSLELYGVLSEIIETAPNSVDSIRKMHSMLSGQIGPGLTTRLEAYACDAIPELVDMERGALMDVCLAGSTDTMMVRDYIIQTLVDGSNNKERLIELVSVLWREFIRRERAPLLTPDETQTLKNSVSMSGVELDDDLFLVVLTNDSFRETYCMMEDEVAKYPIMLSYAWYSDDYGRFQRTMDALSKLADNITSGKLTLTTLDILGRHPVLAVSLSQVKPNFDSNSVKRLTETVKRIKSEWHDVLVAFRDFMPEHPRFKNCSDQQSGDVTAKMNELDDMMINAWKSPSIGGNGMRELADRLAKARGSMIYQWIWRRQCTRENEMEVSADASVAVTQWKNSVHSSFIEWADVSRQIASREYLVRSLLECLRPVLVDEPKSPEIPNNSVQAEIAVSNHMRRVDLHRQTRIRAEVDITITVLGAVQGVDKTTLTEVYLEFLDAIDFQQQAIDLLSIAQNQGCVMDDNDSIVHYIRATKNEPGTLRELVSTFRQMLAQYPIIRTIFKDFPKVVLALIRERENGQYGLLELFSRFVSIQLLNQTIDRIIAEVDERNHSSMSALQDSRAAFGVEIDQVDCYLQFCSGRMNQPKLLFEYLARVCWCISSLRKLTGEIDVLMTLFVDGVSSTSTIRQVHLLQLTGWFIISLPEGKLSAKYLEPDKNNNEVVLTSLQLGDIPFQLCLTGNTRSGQDDDDELGVHADHAYFLQFLELVSSVADVLSKLAAAGHPNYQERPLYIPGNEPMQAVEQMVREHKSALEHWHDFLDKADSNLPLLTCLTRKQLVSSIRILSSRATDNPVYTKNTLIALFRSVYPSHDEGAVDGIISKFLQTPPPAQSKLSELAASVHNLLFQGVSFLLPPVSPLPRLQAQAVSNFKNSLPDRLKVPSGVTVLRLTRDDRHTQNEVTVALYVTLFTRLPAVTEVFTCSPDSSELEVVDFIRRWAASTTFATYLSSDQKKLMFCMMNTEKLRPNIQNIVLAKIHEYRRRSAFPLLVVTAPSNEEEAIVAAGLRGDVIIDSSGFLKRSVDVCTAFLRVNASKIDVFMCDSPSAGKTTAILEKYVVPVVENLAARDKRPYARIPITGSIDEAAELLSNIEFERRRIQPLNGIVLHFNISNSLDMDLVNRFLFMYLITKVIFNSEGNYIVRHAEDTVAIEWPSEGVLAERAWAQCGLCRSFLRHLFEPTIRFLDYRFVPFDGSHNSNALLHDVVSMDDPNLRIGLQMMLAFYKVPPNTFTMPYQQDICNEPIPAPQELYSLIRSKLMVPHGPPVTPAVVFRYVRFLANQLVGLHNMWLYQICTPESVAEDTAQHETAQGHIRNVLRLAYHFARCSHRLALDLAASAVPSMSEEFVDNDTRLEHLTFNFGDWKDKDFLIFSGEGMPQMVSTSGDIFLETVCRGDSDANFRAYLEMQHHKQAGKTVDTMCCGLSDEEYDPVENQADDHSLRKLLAMIGDFDNFGWHIFETLKMCHDGQNPDLSVDAPILNIRESALQSLRAVSIQDDSAEIDPKCLDDDRTVGDFIQHARSWFRSICGSCRDPSPPFVLTVDNLCRLLAIKLRLVCKIPVVFMGETGCGKTHAVRFYSRVCGRLFEVINIHGGLTPADLLKSIQEIVSRVDGKPVIVLLDEVNSMPCVWTIKELVCEGFILGRRIPDNIRFICIMNPRRRRAELETAAVCGLDYSPYQKAAKQGEENTFDKAVQEPSLVYEVHRSPESVMSLVWDFGIPSTSIITREKARLITHGRTPFPDCINNISDEVIFAENLVHWMITAKLRPFHTGPKIGARQTGLLADFRTCDKAENHGEAHYRYLRALLCAVIEESQRYLREVFADCSAASLRDIQRTISLIPFIMSAHRRLVEVDPALGVHQGHLYFEFLNAAVQVSLTLNYGLRLTGPQRQIYYGKILGVWGQVRSEHSNHQYSSISTSFLPVPTEANHIYRMFDRFAKGLCDSLALEQGMAINEALKENVTSLFCSIMGNQDTGIAQFIVGRPGSSKSSSLDILCASTDPNTRDPRCRFFRSPEWFEVRKFVLQCTPDTKAADILRVARSAANYQSLNPKCRCVIVLEEVGVTVGSVYNPLMVLHGLVDRGVLMEDGKYIKLPIVGVSNWRLDASKMNRMRATHRGNPSVNDLMLTAECIIQNRANGEEARFDDTFNNSLRTFAQVFSNNVLGSTAASEDIKELGWFYGMRDFYAFVQMLQYYHSLSLEKELGMDGSHICDYHLDPHLVRWATKCCFGGMPDERLELCLASKINDCFFRGANQKGQTAKWKRRDTFGEETHERYQCDMCCRVAYYKDIKVTATGGGTEDDDTERRLRVFDQYSSKADRTGCRCSELDSADAFPTVKILCFLLHVHLNSSRSFCRMRHVLLFTKANAALHLLHSLNIVRRRNVVIVFGRSEATTKDILEDLLRVRRCMIGGKVLILVGAKHLYESMYDSLNQHYSVEGEGDDKKYFTRLTMNGYTASFPIHQSFRCIAIEQVSTAHSLLPPFINRFAKAHLNYLSALSIPQVNLVRKIRGYSVIGDVDDSDNGSDVLQHLIPGLTIDTIHSLAFLFPAELLKSSAQFRKAEECAVARLSFLCSPRRMQHIAGRMFEAFSSNRAQETVGYWNSLPRTHTLKQDYELLLAQSKFAEDEQFQHLFLLTEQRHLDFLNVRDNLLELYPDSVSFNNDSFLNLNLTITDGELTGILNGFHSFEHSSFLMAICDMTHHNAADQVERFIYLVNTLSLPADKHIVLVGLVRNSSVPATEMDKFHLHFDVNWCYLFLDEVDTTEQASTAIPLAVMLSSHFDHVAALLEPQWMCELIQSKSLSLAQQLANGSGQSVEIIQSELEQTFGLFRSEEEGSSTYCGGVATTMCQRICAQLFDLDSLAGGRWKILALRQIRYTHTLRQQLYLYLAGVVQRCLLQFATPLFGFGNFSYSVPGNPFEELFCTLLNCPVVVSPVNLSGCPQVDLPCNVDWRQTASADFMFDLQHCKDATKVNFPFAFLLYHVLQPVAMSAGEDGVRVKLGEILMDTVLSEEEAEAYAADIWIQKGVEDVVARRVLNSILNAYFGCNVQGRIEKLHTILETERKIVEAVIRFVTNPLVQLVELDSTVLSGENLGQRLLEVCTDGLGIVDLGSTFDVIILSGNSFALQLHQAVAAAAAPFAADLRRQSAELAKRCHSNHMLLVKEFEYGGPCVVSLSKFLLPVLFRNASPAEMLQIIETLLAVFFKDFSKYPLPAIGFLTRHALQVWLRGDECPRILAAIADGINRNGADSAASVLVSRMLFDLCDNADAVLNVLGKASQVANECLRHVLLTGALTGGLELICDRLKGIAANFDESSYMKAIVAEVLSNQIQATLSQNEPLVTGATQYVLRTLSSSGAEVDLTKACLVNDFPRSLPSSIGSHIIVQELLRPKEQDASTFAVYPDYSRAVSVLKGAFMSRETSGQHLIEFEQCHELGAVAAVLDIGFCLAAMLSANELNLVALFVPSIQNERLRAFANAVICSRHPAFKELGKESRKAWISAVLLILTCAKPICLYYARIITGDIVPAAASAFPAISPVANEKLASHAHRFLHAAATLANAVMATVHVPCDPAELNRHKNHIFNEILTSRAPCCNRPVDFWPGCFAVTCECSGHFCGWCFLNTGGDAHPHVLICNENPQKGNYFGSEQLYYEVRNRVKLTALKRYLDDQCSPAMRSTVLDACLAQLRTLKIPTDTLGGSSTGYSIELSVQRLASTGSVIKTEQFAGSLSDDPAFVWLQGMCLLHFAETAGVCNNEADSRNCMLNVVNGSGTVVSVVDAIRASALAAAGNTNDIAGILSWDASFESKVQQMTEAQRRMQLPHHFAYRRQYTEAMFRHNIANEPELSFLSYLMDNRESLEEERLSRVVAILDYVGDLVRVCYGRQLTSADATQLTLGDVAADYDFLGGERMARFCDNLAVMYNVVQRYECKGRVALETVFGGLQFDETLALWCVLPRVTNGVSLIPVIYKGMAPDNPPLTWKSLGHIQNDTVHCIRAMYDYPERSAKSRPFKLSMEEVTTFDIDRELFDNLALFIDPQPIATLTSDIKSLQHMVAHSMGLWGKPSICAELPEFQYSDEQKKSIFGKVALKIGLKQLTPKMRNMLLQIAQNRDNAIFVECMNAFLSVLALEIVNRPLAAIPMNSLADLARSVTIPLTPEQETGKNWLCSQPIFAKEFQPAHIVAICAQLWEGAVIEQASVPLDDETEEELVETLTTICEDPLQRHCAANLRVGIRLLGIQFLCAPQTEAFLAADCMSYLEGILGDNCENFLLDTCLARIPVLHFREVFEIAERILSTVVIDDPSADGRMEFEVPLQHIRPARRGYVSPHADLGDAERDEPAIPTAVDLNQLPSPVNQSRAEPDDSMEEAVPTGKQPPRRSYWGGGSATQLYMD
jgi:hypothetical protein